MNRDFTLSPDPADTDPGSARRQSSQPASSAITFALRDHSEGHRLDTPVGDVHVHADERAARLADGLDADAFTRGRDIYFAAGMYDPGTEAGSALLRHELGHVAQQARGEVSAYAGTLVPEHHASEAPAASGAALERTAPVGAGPASIQRQPKKKQMTAENAADPLWVLDVVLHYAGKRRAIEDSSYRTAFEQLYGALEGKTVDGKDVSARTRSDMFDKAVLGLRDVIAFADDDTRHELASRRTKLIGWEAVERAKAAVDVNGKVLEIPEEGHPEKEAEAAHEVLKKLGETAGALHERMLKLAEGPKAELEKAIEELEHGPHAHELEGFLKTLEHDARQKDRVLGPLQAMQGLLDTFDGWLTLNDEELKEHLNEVHHVFPTVESYTELVKAIVEFTAGGVTFTALLSAGLARVLGETELALDALSVASQAGEKLAKVLVAVEVLHGLVVLFDPEASRMQKIEAGVDVASGGALLLGSTPVSIAILGGWFMFKEEIELYWQGALGINTLLMQQTFEFMQGQGQVISDGARSVRHARGLLEHETDPVRAQALKTLADDEERNVAKLLDFFLGLCLPRGDKSRPPGTGWLGGYALAAPGNVDMLAEVFAPVQHYRGVGPGPELPVAVAHVLQRIKWCLVHAREIEVASTLNQGLQEVAGPAMRPELYSEASSEQVRKEIGSVPTMRIEFTARGYRPEDVSVVRTTIPGLDPLWYVMGTSTKLTLGDLSTGTQLVIAGKVPGDGDVRFTRDAAGRLAYPEVPSTTGDYFRAVAMALGQRSATMREESFTGMVDVYARIMGTPVNGAHLAP